MAEGVMDSSELSMQEVTVEEAVERFLSELEFQKIGGRMRSEEVDLVDSLARITSLPVTARMNSPHYYAAALDGMAVRSADTFGASVDNGVELGLGTQGVFVELGSPLPAGMDAVLPVAELAWAGAESVRISRPSNPFRNVRPVGEDIAQHEVLLPKDHRIEAVDIGAMAAAGVDKVRVYGQPKVAIIPLGNHLVPPGALPDVGQMVDSSSPTLAGLISQSGGVPVIWPVTSERLNEASETVAKAAEENDLVFVLAGASHGSPLVARLLYEIGERVVNGVAVKPCSSVVMGFVGGKPLIGFPFHAVGVFAAFDLFARPLLAELLGPAVSLESMPSNEALLSVPLKRQAGMEEIVRVKMGRVDGRRVAVPELGGASTLMSLVRASGYMRVPADIEEIKAGSRASVRVLASDRKLEGNILLLGTHDISYDLLRSHLLAKFPDLYLHTAATGGMKGLVAVRAGLCHMAAIHLFDEATGEYNVPFLKEPCHGFSPGEGPAALTDSMILVNLFSRDLGLIVSQDNPLGIQGLADLARPDVHFINRQKGSGTRVLLDYHLQKAGVDPSKIQGFNRELKTHMAVAAAVSSGAVDVGPGISTAARTLRLGFVPCISERLDLAIPKRFYNRFPVAGLIEVIRSSRFKKEAEKQFADYDFTRTGEVLWDSP